MALWYGDMQSYSETAEVFSEIHIERLLLFSVIWSYGSVLEGSKDQLKFSHLLKTLTNSLPDDDSQSLVFDYYVDESGEWDVWQSRYKRPMDLSGAILSFKSCPSPLSFLVHLTPGSSSALPSSPPFTLHSLLSLPSSSQLLSSYLSLLLPLHSLSNNNNNNK